MLNNALRSNVSFSGLTGNGTLKNDTPKKIYIPDDTEVKIQFVADNKDGYEYLINGQSFKYLDIDTIDNGTKVQFSNTTTIKPNLNIKSIKDKGQFIQEGNTVTNIGKVLESSVVLKDKARSNIDLLSNSSYLRQNDQSDSNIKKVIGNARIALNPDDNYSECNAEAKKAICKIEEAFDGSVLNNKPGHIQLELYENAEMTVKPEMQGKFRIYQYGNSLLNADNGMATIFNEKSIFDKDDKDPDIAKLTSRIDVNGNSRLVNSGSLRGRIDVNLHDTSNSDIYNLTVKNHVGKDVKITQTGTSISHINALIGQLQLLNSSSTEIAKLHGILDASKEILRKPTDEKNDEWKGKHLTDNRSFARISKVEPAPLPLESLTTSPQIIVDGHSKVEYSEGYPEIENRNKKFGLGAKVKLTG